MLRWSLKSMMYLLTTPCMTKTGSSTWSRPCMHDYSCGLSLCFPPLLWDLVIEAVMIDYGVLWDQCYPRYNQWAVMTILCQYSSERELLLRNVFQDWIVDDGNNYYTTCGNPHMAIMTPSDESLSKPFGRVFSPINSAGQWVFLLMRRKSSWTLKINLFRSTFEKWCHELWNQTSPHLFPFIGLKISFCHFDAIAATLINPLQTQALLGPNHPSNQ